MQDLTAVDIDRATTIVDEGRQHAAARFERFTGLHDRLCSAALKIQSAGADGLHLVPPGPRSGVGTIIFDPDYILALAREHRHPEWVVCARIERLVLLQLEAWETDEKERNRLVAHGERCRARSVASKAHAEILDHASET